MGRQAEGQGHFSIARELIQHPKRFGNAGKIQDHPNVIKIYGMYEDAKSYYIVSELIKGKELFDEFKLKKKFN